MFVVDTCKSRVTSYGARLCSGDYDIELTLAYNDTDDGDHTDNENEIQEEASRGRLTSSLSLCALVIYVIAFMLVAAFAPV